MIQEIITFINFTTIFMYLIIGLITITCISAKLNEK